MNSSNPSYYLQTKEEVYSESNKEVRLNMLTNRTSAVISNLIIINKLH